jgi:hypothetical protein
MPGRHELPQYGLGQSYETGGKIVQHKSLTILQTLTYCVSRPFVLDSGYYISAAGELPRVTFFAGMTYAVGDPYRHLKGANC